MPRRCLRPKAAGRVRGTVSAVGAHGKDGHIVKAADAVGGGQGQLLVAAAFAVSPQADHCLSARQESQRLSVICVAAGDRRQEAAGPQQSLSVRTKGS